MTKKTKRMPASPTRTLADCAEAFQTSIKELAAKYEKDPEMVYGLWLSYAKACTDYDQSPVLFENWNKTELCK